MGRKKKKHQEGEASEEQFTEEQSSFEESSESEELKEACPKCLSADCQCEKHETVLEESAEECSNNIPGKYRKFQKGN